MSAVAETGERTTTLSHLCIASLWFAFFVQWMSVVPLVLPTQISGILGPGAVGLEGITGTIVAAGALVSLVVSPIAGAISDRWRSRSGRRRPFLIIGMIGSSLGLLALVPFGQGGSLVLYALAFMNLQLWWNLGAGPYAGLVADMVPKRDQNMASAWLTIMTIAGTLVANILVPLLYRPDAPGIFFAVLIAINLAALAVMLTGVREPASTGSPTPFDLASFLRSFWIDPAQHPGFFWVLITRLISNLGLWSVFTFMLFYFQTVLGIGDAINLLPILLAGGALLAVPASLIGAGMAARYGIVRIVGATSWIMAASAVGYVVAAFHPQLWLIVPVGLMFSVSYGAYQAVDWALALRVLPDGTDAGKDMGIWHISMVLPQIIGPAVSGWIISGLSLAASARFAYLVAFCLAAACFIVAARLIRKIRLPAPA